MAHTATRRETGLTAIELLIIISIFAIVSIFAAPLLSKVAFPSDFQEAIKITESSVEHARHTARLYKTDVFLRFDSSEDDQRVVISLSIPMMRRHKTLIDVGEEFQLPAGIRVVSDEQVIHFNREGDVELPAHNLLVYNEAKDKNHLLVID